MLVSQQIDRNKIIEIKNMKLVPEYSEAFSQQIIPLIEENLVLNTSVSNLPLTNRTASFSIDMSTSPFVRGTTILSNIIRVKEVFV